MVPLSFLAKHAKELRMRYAWVSQRAALCDELPAVAFGLFAPRTSAAGWACCGLGAFRVADLAEAPNPRASGVSRCPARFPRALGARAQAAQPPSQLETQLRD